MPSIKFERFARQKMNRYSIARKRIHGEQIEFLRRFVPERQSRVTRDNPRSSRAAAQEREICARNPDHIRIDLVNRKSIG